MQKIKIASAFIISFIQLSAVSAQLPTACSPDQQTVCVIKLSYDAAGNRTKREQVCTCIGAASRVAPTATNPKTKENSATTDDKKAIIGSLQPNPTRDAVNVFFVNTVENAILSIHDAMGKQLATYIVSGSEYVLELTQFSSGVYYITIQDKEKIETKKVFKVD